MACRWIEDLGTKTLIQLAAARRLQFAILAVCRQSYGGAGARRRMVAPVMA